MFGLLLLGVTLTVNAPECNKMTLSGNTITVTECSGAPQPTPPPNQPTPTPKPVVTPTPGATAKPGAKCPNGMLTPMKDWIAIQPGVIHNYCFDVTKQQNRLTVFTNDRSGVNLCAHIILTVVPPESAGMEIRRTGPGTTADQTIRYFQLIPPGRYQVIVEGAPMECETPRYRIEWGQ